MKRLRRVSNGLIGIMLMLLVGCASEPTRLEADYGTSFRLARDHQISDFGAEKNLAPVYGFDGKASEATIERYRATFEKPPPPPAFTIAIGQVK